MAKAASKGIKIAELARRSGTPKETIHYYLRAGLLPKPTKTSKNMAYYDEAHVEQLQLIRRLRTESYLPLSAIKKVLEEDRLAESIKKADMAGELFGLGAKTELEPLTRAQLLQETGLDEELLERCENLDLLRPPVIEGQKRYRWEEVRLARIIASALEESGPDGTELVLERLQILERHVKALVRDEAAHFFGRVLAGGDPKRSVEILRGGRETIGRYLAVARVRRLRDDLETIFSELQSAFSLPPPDVFRASDRRRKASGMIDELAARRARFEAEPRNVDAAQSYLELLVLDADPARAIAVFESLHESIAADEACRLLYVEALTEVRRFEEAVGLIEPLVTERPGADMMVEALHAMSVLGRLHESFGLSDAGRETEYSSLLAAAFMASGDLMGALTRGFTALMGAKLAPSRSPLSGLRAKLLIARIESVTPSLLGLRKEAARDLEASMEQARTLRGGPRDPGLGILERLEMSAALYALAVTRTEGERETLIHIARGLDRQGCDQGLARLGRDS